MEQSIKVSVLVPFYNVENFVGRCVESLFTQTYDNIEYVFVNNCSTDKSRDIITDNMAKYGVAAKCKLIDHEENLGIAVSRNDCLDNATGDYILFVDSDDYVERNMVELLVHAAVENDADIAGCSYISEFAKQSIRMHEFYPNDHDKMMRHITMLRIKACMWKMLIRRSVIEDNHVRFLPKPDMVDDYLFCCQVVYYARTYTTVQAYLYHYVHYNPNNYSKRTAYNVETQASAIMEVEKFYREKGVYDVVKQELEQRKFFLKAPLVLDKKCINVKRWRELMPECNDGWHNLPFTFGNKLTFWLADSPLWRLVQLKAWF